MPTGNQKKLLSAIVFFLSYILLLLFMDLFRNAVEVNFFFFWLLVLLIFLSVMYQILKFGNQGSFERFIVFEIVLIVFFFQAVYPMLLNGFFPGLDDGYVNFAATRYIQENRNFLTAGVPGDPSVITQTKWPFLSLLSLVFSKIVNIRLFDVVVIFPSIISSLGSILIYAIGKRLYDARTGLLAFLCFSPFWDYSNLHTRFVHETVGFVFFLACILFYVRRANNRNAKEAALLLLFTSALVFTHHASCIILLGFFVVMLLQSRFQDKFSLNGVTEKSDTRSAFLPIIIIAVFSFSHWMYIGVTMLEVFALTIADFSRLIPTYTPYELTSEYYVVPFKEIVDTYWSRFYIILFAAIMLYEVLRQRNCEKWRTDFMLTSWAVAVFLAFFSIGAHTLAGGITHLAASRIFTFMYPFALMVVAHSVLKLKSARKRTLLNALLIGFILLQVFKLSFVPLAPFAQSSQPVHVGDANQELRVVSWYENTAGSKRNIAASELMWVYTSWMGMVSDAHVQYITTDSDLLKNNMSELRSVPFAWPDVKWAIFLNPKAHWKLGKMLDEEQLSSFPQDTTLVKCYENGEWEIYAER